MRKAGFNLSEVLVVLLIIGIISIMLLLPFIRDTKNKEYDTARKRVLSLVGEAVKMLAAEGALRDAVDAEDFVENYLSRHLKVVKTCANENLKECGIETGENKIFNFTDKKMTMPVKIGDLTIFGGSSISSTNLSTKSYGMLLTNGYSLNVFYNPNCKSNNNYKYTCCDNFGVDNVCLNVVYDINGRHGPNQVGKDIGFVTAVYPDINVQVTAFKAAPQNVTANYYDAGEKCLTNGKNFVPPTKEDIIAIQYNTKLLGFGQGSGASSFGTTLSYGDDKFVYAVLGGDLRSTGKNTPVYWRCIER